MIEKDQESKQEINAKTYLKKKKMKSENMEETDIKICLKKRKTKGISKNDHEARKLKEKVLIFFLFIV